jgi:hypothetical protein
MRGYFERESADFDGITKFFQINGMGRQGSFDGITE